MAFKEYSNPKNLEIHHVKYQSPLKSTKKKRNNRSNGNHSVRSGVRSGKQRFINSRQGHSKEK